MLTARAVAFGSALKGSPSIVHRSAFAWGELMDAMHNIAVVVPQGEGAQQRPPVDRENRGENEGVKYV